jgi:spermidine/putrescine transport system substrate-binding protein
MTDLITRGNFLRSAAALGGGLLITACGSSSSKSSGGGGGGGGSSSSTANRPPLSAEPGNLQILDYAGYDSKPLWKSYAKEFPGKTPHWTYFNSDAEALSKALAGYKGDLTHPCSGYVKSWVQAGLLEPWDTNLIPNFKNLNPGLVERGKVNGQQYQIPSDWGFISLMFRTDKVDLDPNDISWNLMFDSKKYPGKITWYDNPADMMAIGGYAIGAADPWNMTADEIAEVKAKYIAAKPHVRNFWNSESAMQQDFAAGNSWITYAWPSDFLAVKKKVPTAVYGEPKEGKLAFDCGFSLFKGTKNYYHAHKYVNSWVSPQSGEWLLNNFAYGSSDEKVPLNKVSPQLVKAFSLRNPKVIEGSSTHVIQYYPNLSAYGKAWQEIKAA